MDKEDTYEPEDPEAINHAANEASSVGEEEWEEEEWEYDEEEGEEDWFDDLSDDEDTNVSRPTSTLRPTSHHWLGFVISILAFAIYCGTLTPFPYPGESARVITQHLDIDPLRPLANPVYGVIARTIAELPFSTLAFRLNLFSAICAGVCVWLVFTLGYRFLYDREKANRYIGMYVFSGAVAAIYFAISTPVWFAASRAHHVTFDLMLLLTSFYLLTSYRWLGGIWRTLIFALVFSVTIVEYPTALLWLLPMGSYLLVLIHKHGDLRVGLLLGLIGCGLAGLSLYFIFSWQYYQLPVAEWRQVSSYFQVVTAMGHEQYTSFQRSIPRIGWLSVALMSLFPWLMCMMFRNFKITGTEKKFSLYLFLLVIVTIASAVLFNTIAAPWKLVGHQPLLVAPYALLAMALGWVLSTWYSRLLPLDEIGRPKPDSNATPLRAGLTILTPFCLTIIAAVFFNFKNIEARSAGILHAYSEQTLEDLGERKWLLSSGVLDSIIAIVAHDRDQQINLLESAKDRQRPYRNFNATLFDDTRMQSLAKIGLGPLISEWFSNSPTFNQQVAIEHRTSLWANRGMIPMHERTIITGLKDMEDLDFKAILTEHQSFWDEFVVPLQALERQGNPASPFARQLLVRLSRAANNLGVLTEGQEDWETALAFYQKARDIHDDNLSALLNELVLVTARPELKKDSQAMSFAEKELRKEENRIGLKTMIHFFGYIRNQTAIEQLQRFWGIPEQPTFDRSPLGEIERTFMSGKISEALEQAKAYATAHPNDGIAWNLLAVIAGKAGDEASMYDCLRVMNEMGRQWPFVLELIGRLELDKKNTAKGRRFLEQSLISNPLNIRLLELLIELDMQEKNLGRGLSYTKQLLALRPDNATGNLMMGMIHYQNGDYNLAVNALSSSVAKKPEALAINNLAWILHLQGRNERALPLIKEAIEMNNRSHNAWDTLGMILLELEEYQEAETAMDKAIGLAPEQVSHYIHKAQLLLAANREDESAALAVKTLEKFAGTLTSKQENQLKALGKH